MADDLTQLKETVAVLQKEVTRLSGALFPSLPLSRPI